MNEPLPVNREAEWSVVGTMLTKPDLIPEIIGLQLELDDFLQPDVRYIFEAAVQGFYADERVDPVTVGERLRTVLGAQWQVDEGDVSNHLYRHASARQRSRDEVLGHSAVVKRNGDARRLIVLMDRARAELQANDRSPEEVGEELATRASGVVTGKAKRGEILSMAEVGSEYARWLKRQKRARELGIDVGVKTGYGFVDEWTKGLLPGEVFIVGGEPGVGKSAITWSMGTGFGGRQMPKPADKRMATFMMSLEMPLVGSSQRIATAITDIPGDKLREADVTDDELSSVIKAFGDRANFPLYWNFASNFRMSQMKAIIVEAIRRHNVGLIIVDHFRMFDPDRRINNANQEDEAKARFLKEDIAKDLDVAVVCLAHTVKVDSDINGGRPRLRHLRGSGQVAAHADIVAFMYRPYMHATENEKLEGIVKPTTSELIYEKNRAGALGTAHFHFEPAHMTVRDPYPGEY